MTRLAINAEARLRAKSQLTIPGRVADAVGLKQGDRFLVEISPEEPDTIRLHRIRDSYANALSEVYGDTSEHLAEERRSWDRA